MGHMPAPIAANLTLSTEQLQAVIKGLQDTGNGQGLLAVTVDETLRDAVNLALRNTDGAKVPLTVIIDVPDKESWSNTSSNIAGLFSGLEGEISNNTQKLEEIKMAIDSVGGLLGTKLDNLAGSMTQSVPAPNYGGELHNIEQAIRRGVEDIIEAISLNPIGMGPPEEAAEAKQQAAAARVMAALDRRPDLAREVHRLLDERGLNGAASA